ncbi:DUF1738 domain-containing protein [bacterium]|nr:DUF1738 domain-containing protein [bacterium]
MAKTTKANVYEIITQRIMEKMESGVIPWHKPWGVAGAAKNLISGKEYNGINTFLLGSAGFSSAYWATFKQIQEKGGTLKKGSKSEIIIFWRKLDSKNENSEPGEITEDGQKSRSVLRYYRVFNLSQVEGIETEEDTKKIDFVPLEKAEQIIRNYKTCPAIQHVEQKAYYSPGNDLINLPEKSSFHGVEEYYSTLFHEAIHSTGHRTRLDRDKIEAVAAFGSNSYSKEELIAEIGNSFLCAEASIDGVFDNSIAYIQGWVKRFKDQPRMIVQAAAAAQKAVNYILNADHA